MLTQLRERKTGEPARVKRILNFLGVGYRDYLAARTLLNNDLTLEGTIMASTAVEKYFKAVIALRGNTTSGHLNAALLNNVKNYDPKLYRGSNESFLLLLKKVYILRYFENLEPDFSLSIRTRHVLAQLDEVVNVLEGKFAFHQNGKLLERTYHHDRATKAPPLFTNNHVLQGIPKITFLTGEETVYEMRNHPTMGLIEVVYRTTAPPSTNFLGEGLKPGGSSADPKQTPDPESSPKPPTAD